MSYYISASESRCVENVKLFLCAVLSNCVVYFANPGFWRLLGRILFCADNGRRADFTAYRWLYRHHFEKGEYHCIITTTVYSHH